jgi:hypothetical protein
MVSRPSITPEALALAAVSLRHRREAGNSWPSVDLVVERIQARIEGMARHILARGPEYQPPLDQSSEAERAVWASLNEAAAAGDPGMSDAFWRAFACRLDAHLQTYGTTALPRARRRDRN